MITRTIEAPGVEYQEIDLSRYGQNGPLVDTTVFSMGFADRGVDYMPKRFLTMQQYIEEYGYPTNEAERYFFKAAQETFRIGGVFCGARIPYENECKDYFTWVSYSIGENTITASLPEEGSEEEQTTDLPNDLMRIDDSVTSYFTITENSTNSSYGSKENYRLISMEEYDKYLIGELRLPQNQILIVNKTRNKYSVDENIITEEIETEETDCPPQFHTRAYLGIVPVIVSPVAAMAYQRTIEKTFNTISAFDTFIAPFEGDDKGEKEFTNSLSAHKDIVDENFLVKLHSDDLSDIYCDTIEKRAVDLFPQIMFKEPHRLDKNYLRKIGVVVFKMVCDFSNKNKIDFIPVEAFVGSLEKDARDTVTGESMFIDKIINDRSAYISFFSNYENGGTKNASTIIVKDQKIRSLGFYEAYSKKLIKVDEMKRSIDRILSHIEDPNQFPLDVVCDAGVSNIAQFVAMTGELSSYANAKEANYAPQDNDRNYGFKLDVVNSKSNPSTNEWKYVLNRLDTFCRYTRKDCIFVADGLRTLCLQGDEKIVRNTNPKNTIRNSILPKVKELVALNSSYTAGYCDWFSSLDYTTGSRFWCPPSIKAMSVYLYTDRYYDRWDAPAGQTRGVIRDVFDVAFSPTDKEAETIYLNNWNYAISYPLAGIVLEGQKTFQVEKTALDRVNVRRLCLTIKREVTKIARTFKYEGITPTLLEAFRDKLATYLDSVKTGNGIIDYYIVLDERNNTPETIDRNELHVTFAIKPVKTAEFIIIRSVVTNQSANLEEITNSVLY